MTDAEGNSRRGSSGGYGLYRDDTRHLSVYDLTFDDIRPTTLLSTAELGYGSEQDFTNPAMVTADGRSVPKETLEIRRQRIINNGLIETIQVTNFNIFQVTVTLHFDFDADFADMFEVRGEHRQKRGKMLPPEVERERVVFKYRGLDGILRSTELRFSPVPEQLWYNGALYAIPLRHRETTTITVTATPDASSDHNSFPAEFDSLAASYRDWLGGSTQVLTNRDAFNAILHRSLNDVRMLHTNGKEGAYIAAGTPWFSCLFGRDSLITAFQLLAFNPSIAQNALRVLARWQGKTVDDWRDEQPGKILHELRVGEMAVMGEIPMTPYYGSVDSTPLFLMLAADYFSWTGDLDLVRELEPNLLAALRWIDEYGDFDKCGYVEYARRSPKGILNQGWKDSMDGIVNRDGTLVRPPIALAEVQGYVYAAKQGMARLLSLLGRERQSEELRRSAGELKARFNRDFWMEDEGFYGLALGAHKDLAGSITSNPGHCLWAQIVDRNKARQVTERLFRNDMFSGWGIRTFSAGSARYNPLGYHLGTVWPHDNSIIGMGLKKYGFEEELNELATALYDCCRAFPYYRLPELFSGAPRTSHNLPVSYPIACRPQAWAAGTWPMLLQAILGLVPDGPQNELMIVRPTLPYWLDEVEVRGLRVGCGAADLLYRRRDGQTEVSVMASQGIEVSITGE
ncbi:MAG: amylo-alpha-1,6-glucosidase [Bacteroidetes bacterium]|nr:amylo-alpha-1,6-glucosidase [Bacteroidota bacterium]